MVFTLRPFGHTLALCSTCVRLVQFLVIRHLSVPLGTGVVKTFRCTPSLLLWIAMETALSIIAIVTGICFAVWIAVLILRFVDRLTVGKPPTQEEHERQRREFEARLARPQWNQLISHFGCDIPPAIERLYACLLYTSPSPRDS